MTSPLFKFFLTVGLTGTSSVLLFRQFQAKAPEKAEKLFWQPATEKLRPFLISKFNHDFALNLFLYAGYLGLFPAVR